MSKEIAIIITRSWSFPCFEDASVTMWQDRRETDWKTDWYYSKDADAKNDSV